MKKMPPPSGAWIKLIQLKQGGLSLSLCFQGTLLKNTWRGCKIALPAVISLLPKKQNGYKIYKSTSKSIQIAKIAYF